MAKNTELDTLEVAVPLEGRDTYKVLLRDARDGRTKIMEAAVYNVDSNPTNRVLLITADPHKRLLVPIIAKLGETVTLNPNEIQRWKIVISVPFSSLPD